MLIIVVFDLAQILIVFFNRSSLDFNCQNESILANLVMEFSTTIEVGVLIFFIKRLVNA